MELGYVGLGNMGGALARRLLLSCKLRAFDLRPEVVQDMAEAGAQPAQSLEALGQACDAVLLCLPTSNEVREAIFGEGGLAAGMAPGGLAAGMAPGGIIVDQTTGDPNATRAMAAELAERGLELIDAPVSGGPHGAHAGTIAIMAGGTEAQFARMRATFEAISPNVFHCGDVGAGHAMKLIHNMVCHSIFMATCEGGKLAEKVGLKVEDMINVFNVSNARSYASQFRFPNHILSGKWDGKSRVYNMIKDVGMAVKMGKKHRAQTAHGEATLAFLEKAVKRGMIEKDFTLLYRDYEKVAKTRL